MDYGCTDVYFNVHFFCHFAILTIVLHAENVILYVLKGTKLVRKSSKKALNINGIVDELLCLT